MAASLHIAKLDQPAPDTPPISILACGGNLPLEIAQVLRRQGRRMNIVCIAGMADANYDGFTVTSAGIGETGKLLAGLRLHGARDLVIAGHARRPDLRRLAIDWGFVRNIATILSLTRGGDDRVLRRIAAFFERNGLVVRSIAEIAPELLTPNGILTGHVTPARQSAAETGINLIHKLGVYDVGQAVVVEGGSPIAIEGAEGTNGLLGRLPPARTDSGCDSDGRLLIKAAKPSQDQRVDLPTIGSATIDKCAEAGVSAIALEAGRSLIVSRDETMKRAEKAGISVVGLSSQSLQNDAIRSASTAAARRPRLHNHARCIPRPQFRRDARKGLHLLRNLRGEIRINAAIVGRENILAVDVDEPMSAFIQRSEKLVQWGDRREKSKRNRTLVVALPSALEIDLRQTLQSTKIAGFALLNVGTNPSSLDRLIEFANAENYFLLSQQ